MQLDVKFNATPVNRRHPVSGHKNTAVLVTRDTYARRTHHNTLAPPVG